MVTKHSVHSMFYPIDVSRKKNKRIVTNGMDGAHCYHPHDCYFCQTVFPSAVRKKRQSEIQYANVPSVKKAKFIALLDTSDTRSTLYDSELDDTELAVDDFEEGEFSGASGSTQQDVSTNTENIAEDAQVNADIDMVDVELSPTASASANVEFQVPRTPRMPGDISPASTYVSASSGGNGQSSIIPTSAFPSPSSGSTFQVPRHFSFLRPSEPKKPIDLTQARLNDMARDLNLPKDSAELLSSRLKDMGLSEGIFLTVYLSHMSQ